MRILNFGFRVTRFGILGLSLGWLNMVDAQTSTNRSLKSSQEEASPERLEKQLRTLQESLILSNAEADLFRQQWQELRLRNEALGVDALTADEKKLQEKVVQAFKQAYQAERERRELVKLLEQLLGASRALVEAGDNPKPQQRADYEAASRASRDFLDGKRAGAIPLGTDWNNGQIIQVNPELGVVVINLGKAQGVQPGMPFRVLQGDRVIGRVKAYQVREQISAALIEGAEKGKWLKVGDRVAVATER